MAWARSSRKVGWHSLLARRTIENGKKRRETGELQKGSLKVAPFQPRVQWKADLFTVSARGLRAGEALASGGGNHSAAARESRACRVRKVAVPLGA